MSKMNQEEISCILCEKEKNQKEFYKTSSYCKKCHNKYMTELKIEKRREYIHTYIENGEIKLRDFAAADRLLISCQSRYDACRYKKKGYENVKFMYDNPHEFFLVLIRDKSFFSKWIDLTNAYYANDKELNYLPVIDRINEKGHYTLENVQPLTHSQNVRKASQKPCTALLTKNGNIVNEFRFTSKKECNNELQNYVPVALLHKLKYDVPYMQNLGSGYHLMLQVDGTETSHILAKSKGKVGRVELSNITTHYLNKERGVVEVYLDTNTYTFDVNGIAF